MSNGCAPPPHLRECVVCGGDLADHFAFNESEIAELNSCSTEVDYVKCGLDSLSMSRPKEEWLWFCYVVMREELDPCDEEFLESISS